MANKRMFSVDVVETDAFLDLPPKTQALYFHLGMRADDDGFVSSPRTIVRTIGWVQIIKQATRQGWLKFYPLDKDKPASTVPEFESAGDQISRIIENLKRKNGA